MKVGIFPASGGLGGSTTKHILGLVPAEDLILVSRYPSKLAEESAKGATVRKADYDDLASLDEAFEGLRALCLISYPSIQYEHRFEVHKAAIDAALRKGIQHIFYSSLAFAKDGKPDSVAQVMRAHLATEKYLAELHAKDSGFTYTAIREGLYSESFPIYTAFFDPKNPSQEITIPHDGDGPGIAWAKRDELGEATARLVASYARAASDFQYLNRVVLLSGPRVWSLNETVATIARIIGKEVRIHQVTVDDYAQQPQVQKGLSYGGGDWSRLWATAFEAIRQGECAVATPTLGQILGREPEDLETTLSTLIRS